MTGKLEAAAKVKSPQVKHDKEYSRIRRFFWKAFFVAMAVGYLALMPDFFYNGISTLDFIFSLPAIVGLFGYVWAKRFGALALWKMYFTFFLIWELFIVFIMPWLLPSVALYGEMPVGESWLVVIVLAPLTMVALFVALYRYAKGRTLPVSIRPVKPKWYHYKFALTAKEVREQVAEYDTLKFRRSARGQAVICAGTIVMISLSFILVGGTALIDLTDVEFWLGPVMYVLVGVFIYLEKRWAGALALTLLTVDKISAIYFFGAGAIFSAALSWFIFAPFFWRVYQVETARMLKNLKS